MWSRRRSRVAAALVVGVLVLVAPAAAAQARPKPVTIVTLNLLHGLFCPEDTDACQAPDRVQIFGEQLERAGCPDLVGIQEVGPRLEQRLTTSVPTWCDGAYDVAWAGSTMPDRVMVLSRLPVVERGELDIANVPWEAYWVRAKSPQGPVDFLTAHFASSSNNPPCTETLCPPVCPAGISTNECHGIQVAEFLTARRVPRSRSSAATSTPPPTSRRSRTSATRGSSTPGSRPGSPSATRRTAPAAPRAGPRRIRGWA